MTVRAAGCACVRMGDGETGPPAAKLAGFLVTTTGSRGGEGVAGNKITFVGFISVRKRHHQCEQGAPAGSPRPGPASPRPGFP